MQQDYDLIVTVGFLLGEDTAKLAAEQTPSTKFAIVDYAYDPVHPQCAGPDLCHRPGRVLAGYLAAGMTKTGKVGTFGGIEIPPVTIFMDAYAQGVKHYNEVHGTRRRDAGHRLLRRQL